MVHFNNLYIFSSCPCLSQVGGDGLPEDKCKEIAAWSSARTCQSWLLALNVLMEAIGKKHLERGDSRDFVRDVVVGALLF